MFQNNLVDIWDELGKSSSSSSITPVWNKKETIDVLFNLIILKSPDSKDVHTEKDFALKLESKTILSDCYGRVLSQANQRLDQLVLESVMLFNERFQKYVSYNGEYEPAQDGQQYQLKYAQKQSVADVLNNMTKQFMSTQQAPIKSAKIIATVKCKFFPNCENENCSYWHPSIRCRLFPECPHGKRCFYLHPECIIPNCKNDTCIFLHTEPMEERPGPSNRAAKNAPKPAPPPQREPQRGLDGPKIHVFSSKSFQRQNVHFKLPDPSNDRSTTEGLKYPELVDWKNSWGRSFTRPAHVPHYMAQWTISARVLSPKEMAEQIKYQEGMFNEMTANYRGFAKHKNAATKGMLEICVKYEPPKSGANKDAPKNAYLQVVLTRTPGAGDPAGGMKTGKEMNYYQQTNNVECATYNCFTVDRPLLFFYVESDVLLEKSNGFVTGPKKRISINVTVNYKED